MNEAEARRRLVAARVGRLATVTAHGSPHLVPVVFATVDDVLYTAVDSKPKTTLALKRLANIDATGRASLLVDEYSEDWSTLWWVRVDGTARVLDVDGGERQRPSRRLAGPESAHPEARDTAVEALTHKYPQYVSNPPTGPVIAIRLARWRWWEATPHP
ncbi:MAG: TIGR03668 family PPOX class F420-dependent oxidoreductase [Actinomycetota bacterium]